MLMGPVDLQYVTLALRHEADHALPRLRLTAHKVPITDDGVQRGLDLLESVLQRKEYFTILWDVRQCCLPTRAQLLKGTAWANAHKEDLEKYLAGIGVLQSSRLVRVVANFVIAVTKPTQPVCITTDERRVDEFARPIRAPPRVPLPRESAGCATIDDTPSAVAVGFAVAVAAVVVVAACTGGGAGDGGSASGALRGGPRR